MKTLVLYKDMEGNHQFYEVEDDLSKFNEVFIGAYNNDLEIELSEVIASNLWKPILIPIKDWDYFIVCGTMKLD